MKFLRLFKAFRQPKPNEIQKNAKSGGPEERAKYMPLSDAKVLLAISKGINSSSGISKVFPHLLAVESLIFLEMHGYIDRVKTIYEKGAKKTLYKLTRRGEELVEAGRNTRQFKKALKQMKPPPK